MRIILINQIRLILSFFAAACLILLSGCNLIKPAPSTITEQSSTSTELAKDPFEVLLPEEVGKFKRTEKITKNSPTDPFARPDSCGCEAASTSYKSPDFSVPVIVFIYKYESEARGKEMFSWQIDGDKAVDENGNFFKEIKRTPLKDGQEFAHLRFNHKPHWTNVERIYWRNNEKVFKAHNYSETEKNETLSTVLEDFYNSYQVLQK